ncbi:putative bud site selection protein BUD4 [Coleophoma crateriformis]|uniref:Putative bud site selection protein BUD4 n=1 Tax=Coleophoma crateriformis TaxID=565419 RepID=A0A3D8QUR5_9HELO|nr:putative bud site selection protein BUD4 [Coleophoma crateriformis]
MASPSEPVHPLRIQKGIPSSSPIRNNSIPRPLSELGPTEMRRNSPSFNQTTKKMVLDRDSSPFQSSPFNASEGNSSPRLFWQGREPTTPNRINTENLFAARETSASPTRRSSIERLQKASRVKNSNMFARELKQEYDPASVPVIERPLARTLHGNAYGGSGLEGLRSPGKFGHKKNDSSSSIPVYNPTTSPYSPTRTPLASSGANGLRSPSSRDQASPTKSSLSSSRFNPKASFDSENGTWSEENSFDEHELPEGRALHRHAKSVTFDAAPPQVNEYEMATPDLSSIGDTSRENSYDSAEEEDEDDSYLEGDTLEREDSFDASLEDTDKTPVVGPDDWRHASPNDNRGLMGPRFEDPFEGPEGSPMPDARPTTPADRRTSTSRTDSCGSNGDHRPLPPLPGMTRSGSSLSDRGGRNLPSPPPAASVTKSELQGLPGGKMSLEERLQLMMIQDDDKPKTPEQQQRERRMRRAGQRERGSQTPEPEISIHEDEDTLDDLPGLGSYQLPSRISRESILRKVNGQECSSRESDYRFSSPMASSSPERTALPDPDVPLPSTEDISVLEDEEDEEGSVIFKPEPESEDELDVYAIPEMYEGPDSQFAERTDAYQDDVLEIGDTQSESQYTDPNPAAEVREQHDDPSTPKAVLFDPIASKEASKEDAKKSLPDFGAFKNEEFGLGLSSYMTESITLPPPPPAKDEPPKPEAPSMGLANEYLQQPEAPKQRRLLPSPIPDYEGAGWGPSEDEYEEPGTPDSVIRHPIPPSPPRESPAIPEKVATIKSASGSKLKTRPSATPSDLQAMREARRIVSGNLPDIPAIPDRHRNRPSLDLTYDESSGDFVERKPSFKKRSLTLDIGTDLGLSLDNEFDRVIEAQKVVFTQSILHSSSNNSVRQASEKQTKQPPLNDQANLRFQRQRGYLMRHNTKVVVASSDIDSGTRSAGNSPVKMERPQSWTVEPWNGQTRKASLKNQSSHRKKAPSGPVPPMPGQESNATGLGVVSEEQPVDAAPVEGAERGRLFVKVIGVKDLDLPLPKNERSWFSLTLDNGVHCVTTAWLELGRNAPIGQEFELVVPNDLEFQLTLNAKLEKPAPKRVAESPTKKPHKQSTFSRVFASPKKRKELEAKFREEERLAEQKEKEAQAKRTTAPTTWDLLSPLAAEDGSFGRSYVCLKDHESRCYGRPYVVDVAAFNEWATEEASYTSSVKSKRGNTQPVQKRAPYKVAKLQLQLLFVPKPKGATDDDMPKSMNACIREMKEAEQTVSQQFEGHLSQQGGDCPYWRRRFFKLVGNKLTAYHESTRQPRATINLSNARKLIDDRRALTQKETIGKGGSRRKSGFAEEEEGYMFVEEGFRIRFNNGEVIDFYADTGADKEGWMKVLDACIGKEGESVKGRWCDVVLKREESMRRKMIEHRSASGGKARSHVRTKSMIT